MARRTGREQSLRRGKPLLRSCPVRILLASNNQKKLAELIRELANQNLTLGILTPADVGGIPSVIEDSPSFLGNARKKAASAAFATHIWSLADDSGLEVDFLDNLPGVRSARFAGEPSDDAANNRLLLEKLRDIPNSNRTARFICALALARPDGSIAFETEATAHGRILHEPLGARDFGYDPLFLFTEPGHRQTGRGFAELTPDEKAEVSHRGRALRTLARRLPSILAAH